MARVRNVSFVFGVASTMALGVLAGCQNDGGSSASGDGGGKVISQTQNQDVTPGGTAIQTRTQVRQTPSGEVVRETQMQTREVVTPGSTTTGDPTKTDPGK